MAWPDTVCAQAHGALLSHPEAEPARAYLRERGVPEAQWRTYRLGYSAYDLQLSVSPEFQAWAPAYWPNRLVFPLTNVLTQVVGFQTRALDRKDYRTFSAVPTAVFPVAFGMDVALSVIWHTRKAVVVEGVFDALAVGRVAPNVIAALTSTPAVSLRRFLSRYADVVYMLTDMDAAGRQGVSRLAQHTSVVVSAPCYPAHDPGDLVQRLGGEARLRSLLACNFSPPVG